MKQSSVIATIPEASADEHHQRYQIAECGPGKLTMIADSDEPDRTDTLSKLDIEQEPGPEVGYDPYDTIPATTVGIWESTTKLRR